MMRCYRHRGCRLKLMHRWLRDHSFFLVGKYKIISKGEARLGFDKINNNAEDLLHQRHAEMTWPARGCFRGNSLRWRRSAPRC